jgi:hypothetical protein
MNRFVNVAASISIAAGILMICGCQGQPYDATAGSAGTSAYNPPGLPDNSAGNSVSNPPGSMQHVGNQSQSGVLGGGTNHDPNAATPGS